MRVVYYALAAGCLLALATPALAQLTSPQVGWRTELSTIAHGVSGSVTIVDEDTVRVDDFTYDGGGIVVYFYLGESNTGASFGSGLSIGPQLRGTSFDGTQDPLMIDLPEGETLEGWNAISVWCVTAGANFGSGLFAAVPGDYNSDGTVNAADYTIWRDTLGSTTDLRANGDDNGASRNLIDAADYAFWKARFDNGSNGAGGVQSNNVGLQQVPEPPTVVLLLPILAGIGVSVLRWGREN